MAQKRSKSSRSSTKYKIKRKRKNNINIKVMEKVAEYYPFMNIELVTKRTNPQRNREILGNDLSFVSVREFERTKHVHRLHPYLGKFIPQLVEVFLRKYFKKGDTILDPFSGSGTALIEANVLGINATGIELSPFNTLIQKVKMRKYNIPETEFNLGGSV